MEFTTNEMHCSGYALRRTPCLQCLQFSARRIVSGASGEDRGGAGDAGNGIARSQRSLRLSTIFGGRPGTKSAAHHWGGIDDGRRSLLPVLVEDRTGYKNLCELLTQAHLRSEKGECVVRWEELPDFHRGLVALFGIRLRNVRSI